MSWQGKPLPVSLTGKYWASWRSPGLRNFLSVITAEKRGGMGTVWEIKHSFSSRDKYKIAISASSEVLRVTRRPKQHWGSFPCKRKGKEQDECCRKRCSGMLTMIKIVLPALVDRIIIACFHLQTWKIF